MPLAAGARLGHYEILEPIGEGGMGVVYRARDEKLGREVAIKVLPDELSKDQERLARFEREAKLLASVNHSNIATLYGLEEDHGRQFLVMELVEGETLAERIAKGPLPADEAIPLFVQIAEGLEAAHAKGIIHRDLKPANIKIEPHGKPKILDFGLAKAFAREGSSPVDVSQSPTLTRGTEIGSIVGTASYMSPEQARGKPVDKRTDIWAFGCCLYEAVAGRKAFDGESVTDVLAGVVQREPGLDGIDPRLRRPLKRCLEKDAKRRWHDIADVRLELEDAASRPDVGSERHRSSWLYAGLLSIIAASAGSLLTWSVTPRSSGPTTTSARFVIHPSASLAFDSSGPLIAVSPDGKQIAYLGAVADGGQQIYIRSVDQFDPLPIAGTENASHPFFSPDGDWIGFRTSDGLKILSASGGPSSFPTIQTPTTSSASWTEGNHILFSTRSGIVRVPATGGEPELLTTADPNRSERHVQPRPLLGERAVLFTIATGATMAETSVAARNLDNGLTKIVMPNGASPGYASSGHLVFERAGQLFAVPFDPERLEVTGTPVAVLDVRVMRTGGPGNAHYDLATNGALIYLSSHAEGSRKLVWVDRDGSTQHVTARRRQYVDPRLSPDGRRVAVTITSENTDVWIHEIERDVLTRLTFDPSADDTPVWTPDGRRVTFRSAQGGGNVSWMPLDESSPRETLVRSGQTGGPSGWSPTGEIVVFSRDVPKTRYDIWYSAVDESPQPFLATEFNEFPGPLSPDGRWLAYASDESGELEIYVRRFPGGGQKTQISTDGGMQPLWNPDGSELFYIKDDALVAVSVTLGENFSASIPEVLFRTDFVSMGWSGYANYDVTANGERFLMIQEDAERAPEEIYVVLGWSEELKRLVPTDH